MYDCIIIGAGPAGLSAALYTIRAGLNTQIIASGIGALEKASKIDNYFGFSQTVSGAQLIADTTEQVMRLGGTFLRAEVTDVRPTVDGGYEIVCDSGESYLCAALIFATGKSRGVPPIRGLADFEGAGVSHCAVCDGFFYRGKTVGVLGEGKFALSEARELEPLAASVSIYTNGKEPAFDISGLGTIKLDTRRVSSVAGERKISSVVFADGEAAPVDGLFIASGVAGSGEFAAKLGILTENGAVVTDKTGATNVPGIFAAGDCTGAPYQISVSVGEGARAGLAVTEYAREKKRVL